MLQDISNRLNVRRQTDNMSKRSNLKPGHIQKFGQYGIKENRYGTWKKQVMQDRPNYTFPVFFHNAYEKMLPFLEGLPRQLYEPKENTFKAVSLLSEVNFKRNSVRKYTKPYASGYRYKIMATKEVKMDPSEIIFSKHRSNDCSLEYGNWKLTIDKKGSVEKQQRQDDNYDNTVDSKRSFLEMDTENEDTTISELSGVNLSLDSNSSVLIKRRRTAHKIPRKNITPMLLHVHQPRHYLNNHERLDNSRTISAKAILKMVDDTLVSSDTSLYSQSFTNTSLGLTGKDVKYSKECVSINADDLKRVLVDEETQATNNKNPNGYINSTPTTKKATNHK